MADSGDYILVYQDADGTVHEYTQSSRVGYVPEIGATTDIDGLDGLFEIDRVHLVKDPQIKGVTEKNFMFPLFMVRRIDESNRPVMAPGSKFKTGLSASARSGHARPPVSKSRFNARLEKPVVQPLSEALASGASPVDLATRYREQASNLVADGEDANDALAGDGGWCLHPNLPETLHALSRGAKRNAAELLLGPRAKSVTAKPQRHLRAVS